MQISQLGQLHIALLHLHFCFLFGLPTCFDSASFLIENLHFSLMSFVKKSRVSEFYYVFLYHMIPRYIPSTLRVLSLGHIFFNHSRYYHFQYLRFRQVIANDQEFSVAITFCSVSSPSTVRPICFSPTGLVSVRKKTYATTSGNQPWAQVAMVQNGP